MARWPSEERVPFQTEMHARGEMGGLGAVRNFPQLQVECEGAGEKEWDQFIKPFCALLRILNPIICSSASQTSLRISIIWLMTKIWRLQTQPRAAWRI